jgi:hypothetical protein
MECDPHCSIIPDQSVLTQRHFFIFDNLQDGSPAPTPTMIGAWPTDSPTVHEVPTTSAAPSMCIGNTAGWVDSDGDGCDVYEAHDDPGCPLYGHSFDGGMGVAQDNCCYCSDISVSATI